MRLAAVVVSFNRLAALRVTLGRLLEEPVDHVVVVDSGSTDGSRDWLATLDARQVTVILQAENRGGASGFETGLRAAVDRLDPDWCVLMDDDAYPEPGAITRFRALDTAGFDAVAAAVRLPSGQIAEFNRPWHAPFAGIRATARLLRGRAGFHIPDADYESPRSLVPIDGASFVGYFIARSGIARAGFPDGRLFIYGDDVLYSLRLGARGGKMGFAPAIGFVHDCGIVNPRAIVRPLWKTYYLYRNRWHVYRAAAGPLLFWPIMSAMAASWFARSLRLAAPERRRYLRLTRLALADAMSGTFDRSHAEILSADGRSRRP
jgi:GT2 family glycosyltransferase